ncbi:MAG: HAD hydrolase-like protein [Candidatus Andersenbacteria bacterium]|nr:HAD hydrolase-like protein [Candidatus Andersenbacteria bacterium]MBI3250489.1 HAD hydrolase-like protein [Candidatus Andersenbacteria bacterium]
MNFKTILFDFDGVLCFDYFYTTTLKPEHSEIADWIAKNVFEGNRELVRRWMRGEVTSDQVNDDIASRTGIDVEILKEAFEESVRLMKLDDQLLALINTLRKQGTKVGLVTDNMDVFSEITVKNNNLSQKFDAVVNSADYGFLKKEQNGRLFDIALEKLGEKNISKSLMIDNQSDVIELYEKKGGRGFLYKNFVEFKNWIKSQ